MLFDEGLGYSALNTARCALSQIIITKKFCTIGAHPWVVKFMKGVFHLRPPMPRYTQTWDVKQLLDKIGAMTPVRGLSLKDLTLKCVTLVALLLAARSQTLALLNLNNMTKKKSSYIFTVGKADLKQSRPGYVPPVLTLKAYPVNRGLCIYTVLSEYIDRTKDLRGSEGCLFISYSKPHKKVGSSTLARWVKTMMAKAGIDVCRYKAHSLRSASTTKAYQAGVPLVEILKTAGWSKSSTFATYYNRKIEKEPQYANRILR